MTKTFFHGYEKIVKQCTARSQLWEDPEFPAVQSSVFYHQTPPFEFVWKRPKELSTDAVFVSSSERHLGLNEGKFGDQWLMSCMGCLHRIKSLFNHVIPPNQSFQDEDGYCGVFCFRIWWCGRWKEVLVDDRLPTVNGKLVFIHSQSSNEFWPSLLEKAYAKLHGSYEALKYGTTYDGLADFTGGIVEAVNLRQDPTGSSQRISKLLKMTSVVTCTVDLQTRKNQPERLANGISIGVNYRVCALEKVETFNVGMVQLICLQHPLGLGTDYIGMWSRDSSSWTEVPTQEQDRLRLHRLNPSQFCLVGNELICGDLSSIMVYGNEVSLLVDARITLSLYALADSFHINPQLLIICEDPDDVIISLSQGSIMEPKVIGFTIYTLSKPVTNALGQEFFRKHKSLFTSQYTNSRHLNNSCHLAPGSYVLLPTTFDPGQEASFVLRIYSHRTVKFRPLDIQPAVVSPVILQAPGPLGGKEFDQYEAVFLQLADEHRSVNAFELQELLEACLPNDFKDFLVSLKFWQNAFRSHTKEKLGILRAERLRDALLDVGYQLSSDIISVLILRYMRKDGTLRFGDFVSAVLHLSIAFRLFEKKSSTMTSNMKLGLAEWLSLALKC
ncbi:unnamed protein product [Darwinula stevensoni]|uniref:Calpain catalytic domain-containing protein n=1 Tax=Darwinula stevensoni TaxID=69355 RepID=A0A7R8WYK6_9CRUS|nr:unnamed protein product [Darwinula stevensoni]CAG0879062.1 unnamed protein product [Darwinula stevensoni]